MARKCSGAKHSPAVISVAQQLLSTQTHVHALRGNKRLGGLLLFCGQIPDGPLPPPL